MNGVGEVDDGVERRHAGFGKGQVHLREGDMKVTCKYEPHHVVSLQVTGFSAELLKCSFLFGPHSSATLHCYRDEYSSESCKDQTSPRISSINEEDYSQKLQVQ